MGSRNRKLPKRVCEEAGGCSSVGSGVSDAGMHGWATPASSLVPGDPPWSQRDNARGRAQQRAHASPQGRCCHRHHHQAECTLSFPDAGPQTAPSFLTLRTLHFSCQDLGLRMACEDVLESFCTGSDQREGLWPGAAHSERSPRNMGTDQSENTRPALRREG